MRNRGHEASYYWYVHIDTFSFMLSMPQSFQK